MKCKDPVCGMTIEDKDAAATSTYRAKTYYFCSTSCKDKFEKDPESYISVKGGLSHKTGELKLGEMFTCPMHPEVRQAGPGACPKCGMAPAAINTAYAWYVHMEGARMFYGQKEQFFLLWPVRGKGDTILPATGQTRCYDASGQLISCAGSGQDGEFRSRVRWPEPALRSRRAWSSTGSRVSAGAHQPTLQEDRRHGRKRSKQ